MGLAVCALTLAWVSPRVLGCGYYAAGPITPTPTEPDDISEGDPASTETPHRIVTFTASNTTSGIVADLCAHDDDYWVSCSKAASGTAKGEITKRWEWCGDPSGAPGCNFTASFNGDGDVTAGGQAQCEWLNGSASSSTSGTSSGSGSCPGSENNVSANCSDVGGTCTGSSEGGLSGSASHEPQKTGISAHVYFGQKGVGSYAHTGDWGINYTHGGSVGTGTSLIEATFKNKCIVNAQCNADGVTWVHAWSTADVTVNSTMSGNLYNFVY